MNFDLFNFDGIPLQLPVIDTTGRKIELPPSYKKYTDFGSYCGSGRGIGDKLVPEVILGLRVSLACYIHDQSWDIAEATWDAFHLSNFAFFHNLMMLNSFKSSNTIAEHLRVYRIGTYYNSVDTIGAMFFWKCKIEQGLVSDYPTSIPEMLIHKSRVNR